MAKRMLLSLAILTLSAASAVSAENTFDQGFKAWLVGDVDRAISLWEEAAARGDLDSQFSLGLVYLGHLYSRPPNSNTAAATKWYNLGANNGSDTAAVRAATSLVLAGDASKARDTLITAIDVREPYHDLSVALAAHWLATMSLFGIGDKVDLPEAEAWFAISAQNDYAPAQYSLGKMHVDRLTAAPSTELGLSLIHAAAEQGFPPAQYNLGKFYRDVQDYDTSVWWLTKSADQGYSKAQRALAWRYHNGEGVEKDDVKALAWAKISKQDDPETLSLIQTLEESLGEEGQLRASQYT
jgi:TPR repeat protein